jgi:TP901-1 family phage major tail protein
MSIEHSRNLFLKVGQGLSPESYIALASQTDGTLSMSAGTIDVANKTTLAWAQSIPDLRDYSVRVSAVITWPDTTGVTRVRTEAIAGNSIKTQTVLNSSNDNFIATTGVTDMEFAGANRDATRFNSTFTLATGVPVFSNTI